ncbi:MAG: hypothetical protein AB7I27_14835 [Bacteriovoracaceae bacterium]
MKKILLLTIIFALSCSVYASPKILTEYNMGANYPQVLCAEDNGGNSYPSEAVNLLNARIVKLITQKRIEISAPSVSIAVGPRGTISLVCVTVYSR